MKIDIKKALAGSVIVTLLFQAGCGKPQPGARSADSGEPSQDSLETKVDRHGDEVMASTTKAEARQWMKQPKHVFFKADPKEVAQFVEDFYQAGATQVLIADIEEEEGNQYGEALLIVLPGDATLRAKIFEVGTRADTSFQNDPVSDKGQKYLYYSLD